MRTEKRSLILHAAALLLCVAVMTGSVAGKAYAAPGAIAGKSGWYFTTFDSANEDYRGTNLFSPLELQLIRQKFTAIRDSLAEQGIDFVVYLAPNKEHIYDEYMPDSSGKLASYTRIQQVYDLLKDEFTVIYPEEMLREAKEKYPYDLYYKTDSHWNDVGTYLCCKLLLEELGYEMPELEELTVTPYATDDKDCAQLLGKSLPDVGYTVTGYEDALSCEDRFFICGDSFGMQMAECITPVVANSSIIHRDLYEPEMLDIYSPTVFVYEILERFMDVLPYLS